MRTVCFGLTFAVVSMWISSISPPGRATTRAVTSVGLAKSRPIVVEKGEVAFDDVAKLDLAHPALQSFGDPILLESLKSARVWGYIRANAAGKRSSES